MKTQLIKPYHFMVKDSNRMIQFRSSPDERERKYQKRTKSMKSVNAAHKRINQ